MLTYLRRLTDERDSLTQAATDLADRAATEERDLTDTETTSMRSWQERCAQIDGQLSEYNAQAESQRAYARLRDELHTADADPPAERVSRVQTRDADPLPSWGEAFVESEAFANYEGAGTSRRVTVGGVFDGLQRRAAIMTGEAPAIPYFYAPGAPAVTTPLMDVCGHVTVAGNSVSYVAWTPAVPAAAPVVAEGAVKPELALTGTPVTDTLDTYAHWKGITRQALEDIPQIQSTVETKLRQGIFRALELATVAALGAATIPPATGSAAGGDTLLTTIRVGLATVQGAGYTPNAVLLNPADAADIDLAIMAGTLGGAAVNGSLWGLRLVAVPDLAGGTAYVGDFQSAVQVFDRGQTSLYMSDSHDDYFVRNIILLLAEIRALVAVPEPTAAAECTVGV